MEGDGIGKLSTIHLVCEAMYFPCACQGTFFALGFLGFFQREEEAFFGVGFGGVCGRF
jgi:hypothetical protein